MWKVCMGVCMSVCFQVQDKLFFFFLLVFFYFVFFSLFFFVFFFSLLFLYLLIIISKHKSQEYVNFKTRIKVLCGSKGYHQGCNIKDKTSRRLESKRKTLKINHEYYMKLFEKLQKLKNRKEN